MMMIVITSFNDQIYINRNEIETHQSISNESLVCKSAKATPTGEVIDVINNNKFPLH